MLQSLKYRGLKINGGSAFEIWRCMIIKRWKEQKQVVLKHKIKIHATAYHENCS